jgi:hypothetical protein
MKLLDLLTEKREGVSRLQHKAENLSIVFPRQHLFAAQSSQHGTEHSAASCIGRENTNRGSSVNLQRKGGEMRNTAAHQYMRKRRGCTSVSIKEWR